jgi:hypothetical protein
VLQKTSGKLKTSDERVARLLSWTPWLSFLVVTLPLPIIFLGLFLASGTTDSAAVYLVLSFVSMGLGLVVGLLVLVFLLLYRKRWFSRLRDRLATDGITATEVAWFASELSTEERTTWRDLKQKNPLLADAYCETLAARLTATRIVARARGGILKIERQLNRARNISVVNTSSLLDDLLSDRARLDVLRQEATIRLSEARARLQTIEATANRVLNETETDLMLRRLAASQEQFPLALEMANLERDALREIEQPQHKKLPERSAGAPDTSQNKIGSDS